MSADTSTLESQLMALPLRPPSAGFVERVLALRPARAPAPVQARWRWAAPAAAAALVLALGLVAAREWWRGRNPTTPPPLAGNAGGDKKTARAPVPASAPARAVAAHASREEGSRAFSEGLAMRRSRQTSKLGFIDVTGQWVIKPEFSYNFTTFVGGLALVESGEERFFIDRSGQKAAIPDTDDQGRKFLYCSGFSHGLAVIAQNDRYGYADRKGKIVIAPTYRRAERFSEGLALVERPAEAGQPSSVYIDPGGKVLLARAGLMEWDDGFHEGLAAVRKQENRMWGYIGHDSQFAIEAQFIDARAFSEGLAAVAVKTEEDIKWGYIDQTGKTVIPTQFIFAGPYCEGRALVHTGRDKHGEPLAAFIDRKGVVVIPTKRCGNYPRNFSAGLAQVYLPVPKALGRDGYIDYEGNLVLELRD